MGEVVNMYMEDTILLFYNKDEHTSHHVLCVLEHLYEAHFTTKFKKCDFFVPHIDF